jgi:hypothetical protein
MPDHGIKGVDRLIRPHPRRTGHGREEHGGEDAVDGALRHGFDGRTHNLRGLQVSGIAPDDAG